MKIYDRRSFAAGVIFLCAIPCFALGIIETQWWYYVIALAFGAKNLHVALSKSESERQAYIAENYQRVSKQLYGKYPWVKINLPWIVIGCFFTVAFVLKFLFDIVIPLWIWGCFLVALTIAAFYSMGIDREIAAYLDEERNSIG